MVKQYIYITWHLPEDILGSIILVVAYVAFHQVRLASSDPNRLESNKTNAKDQRASQKTAEFLTNPDEKDSLVDYTVQVIRWSMTFKRGFHGYQRYVGVTTTGHFGCSKID